MPSVRLGDAAQVPQRESWTTENGSNLQSWEEWQNQVVALLQKDFGGEALRHIGFEDVDWPSWRDFYLQGKTPCAAIERALERDL